MMHKFTVVYDPENGETIAQELQCVAAKSLEELVTSPDVDCVIVATPNYLHKEPVILAAKNKKHVFCEKPIALSYQDCDDMVRACEENGVTFMAGHVMNFFNGVHHAKELINQGVIGKVLYCHTARNGWEEQQPTISWKKSVKIWRSLISPYSRIRLRTIHYGWYAKKPSPWQLPMLPQRRKNSVMKTICFCHYGIR